MQDVSRAPLSAEEVIELIAVHIDDYGQGGDDREREDIGLGQQVGLKVELIAAQWAKARKQRARKEAEAAAVKPLRPQTVEADRRDEGGSVASRLGAAVKRSAAVKAAPSFKNPPIQPSVAEPPKTPAPPPPPQPEPAEEPKAKAKPEEPPVLNPRAPLDIASEYVERRCKVSETQTLWFWQGQFWRWNERCYEPVNVEVLRGQLYKFLDGSRMVEGGRIVKFDPRPQHVNDVIDCLKCGTALPLECAPPMWMDGERRAPEIVAFANALVNVLTGESQPLTPKLWVQGALGFDWRPEAKAPTWERFLGEVFEGDPETQECMEQWMGLCMTEETKFQKAVMLIGPRRSGKGTISHVLRHLVGDRLYAGLSFNTWTSGENSRQCLIGKRVGVFADVRFKPAKQYGNASYDPGGITHVSSELLLNITGEDTVTVGRKYEGAWHGQLKLKLMLISNEVPNLNDGSGVLPSRFVKIRFRRSFWGHEDPDLRAKLEAELPGIAVRCVHAYRRLCAAGRFVQPESGRALDWEVLRASDPWRAMFDECFVADRAGTVRKTWAHDRFMQWCEENGRPDMRTTPANFTRKLEGLCPDLGEVRPHAKPRAYVGLRLRTSADPPDPRDPPNHPADPNNPPGTIIS